jgi:hypothetical protein
MSDLIPEPGPLSPDYVEPEPIAEPAEPEWQGPSQQDWEQLSETNQYLLDQLGQLAQAVGPGQDPNAIQLPPDSLLAPEDLEVISQLIAQQTAPFQQARDTWIQSEGSERARDVLADDVSKNGDFLFEGSKSETLTLAEAILPEAQARYGYGPQAAEAAIAQAAARVRQWEQSVGKAYYERQINQLRGLSGAPQEPGASTTASPQRHEPVEAGGDELAVVRKYGGFAR